MRSANQPLNSKKHRHFMLWGFMLVFGLSLTARLTDLQVINDDFLQDQGDKRVVRKLATTSYRGMILDRNGEPLAVSSPVPSIWVNPSKLDTSSPSWAKVAQLLELDARTLKRVHNKSKTFVYLKRHISPILAQKINHLQVAGIHTETEYKRYYPTAEVTAHIVGSTNIDHRGVEGLELAYDEILTGDGGTQTIYKDRLGQSIEQLDIEEKTEQGQDVYLSIDSRLQYLAYRELIGAVKKHKAKSGSIVVLDVNTFEVLAMANAPSYNPNLRSRPLDGSARNRAITDQFEPGSVIKPISMAHILGSGRYYPHTQVNTSPGWVKVGGRTVKDVRNYGMIDLGTVIKKSSNVGITKLMLSLPPQPFYDTLNDLGFGKTTDSGFPGEASGHIQYDGQENKFALATLGFGYGISATPLQLAQAYAVIAANGIKKPISFLKTKQKAGEGMRILKQSIAGSITKMLVTATERSGTAFRAQVHGYQVAGKTGTARKVGPQGYSEDSHLALFAGFAPADNPQVVIAVIIDEPSSGDYYGGQVAAPVFSKVMAGALRLRDVSPWGNRDEYLLVKK